MVVIHDQPRANNVVPLNGPQAVQSHAISHPIAPAGALKRSPPPQFPGHRHEREDADGQADEQRGDPQVPFDLLLERRDESHSGRGDADDGFGGVFDVDVERELHDRGSGVNQQAMQGSDLQAAAPTRTPCRQR